MRRRISIWGCVRPSVRPSVRRSVCPVLFSKVKTTHARRILCRVSGLVFSSHRYKISFFVLSSFRRGLCLFQPWWHSQCGCTIVLRPSCPQFSLFISSGCPNLFPSALDGNMFPCRKPFTSMRSLQNYIFIRRILREFHVSKAPGSHWI